MSGWEVDSLCCFYSVDTVLDAAYINDMCIVMCLRERVNLTSKYHVKADVYGYYLLFLYKSIYCTVA